MKNFSELSVSAQLKSNLSKHGFTEPTPVQALAIEPALGGRSAHGGRHAAVSDLRRSDVGRSDLQAESARARFQVQEQAARARRSWL